MIAKHTLTGQTEYSDLRIFQSCSGLILRCETANIPEDAKIEVTLNNGNGGRKLVPNLKIHDLAEINSQRFPAGHYTKNALCFRICDFGALILGDEQHLVINITGLDAAKNYELIANSKALGQTSNRPLVYTENTIPVGQNKTTIKGRKGTMIAIPNSEKIVEVCYSHLSGIQERVNLPMLQVDQREDNGIICVDTKADPEVSSKGFINWFTDSIFQYSNIEIELDKTGFEYILVEGANVPAE